MTNGEKHIAEIWAIGVFVFFSIAVRAQLPDVQRATHTQGKLQWGTSNIGVFRDISYFEEPTGFDPLTGSRTKSGFYPAGSNILYSSSTGFLWIGAKVGQDSLVSCGWDWFSPNRTGGEYFPDVAPLGNLKYRSIDATSSYYSPLARSELDITAVYFDTASDASLVWPGHRPLGLKITQTSMAWSAPNLDDFILIEFILENVGSSSLHDIFIGFSSNNQSAPIEEYANGFQPGLSGLIKTFPSPEGCRYHDTLYIAYGMDNDGNPADGSWTSQSVLGACGKFVLDMPIDSPIINFNWWATTGFAGWGPRQLSKPGDPLRDVRNVWDFNGTDPERYYLLARSEQDYDQLWANQYRQLDGWMPPIALCEAIARGMTTSELFSFGKFDLRPTEQASFVVAFVGGENVHVNPNDYANYINPDYPDFYYEKLDFSQFAQNARWARWVYDNPGYDTDGDGYSGEYRVCDGDTFWYRGDGIPDFRADVPPPAPLVRIIPSEGKLAIRWNGYPSESYIDPFTRQKDFEGYRVYMGLDKRESSLSLISQFDYPNFNRYVMRQRPNGTWDWQNKDMPFTLDSLRQWLADPDFEPLLYPRAYPFQYQDTFYYFERQSHNADLAPKQVHKVYPDAVKPPDDTLLWTTDMLTDEHGKPLPRYFEYEYVLENLLPTVEYYASVTAFDFGFAFGGIPSREASKYANITNAYATPSAEAVAAEQKDVYIWPNPYRYDGEYLDEGFENHDQSLWYDRARRVHFGNLPNKCKISILSLDGDLIKEIHHDFPLNDPEAQHDSFDLISRAGLLVVSGIYYWVVESEGRTQMGKMVIIQ